MQFSDQLVYSHTEESFNIALDKKLYQRIFEDMLENSGDFLPRDTWLIVEDEATEDDRQEKISIEEARSISEKNRFRFPKLTDMLTPWLGVTGRLASGNQDIIDQAREWLVQLGAEPMLDMLLDKSYVMYSDVRTVSEVAMIGHLPLPDNGFHVLEIGGGYGRLCEALLNVGPERMLYVLADSVPLSLVYAYLFLKKNCPQKRIGIYLDDPAPDLAQYDCYIVSTWRLEQLIRESHVHFDLAVNIQSMQEMSQWHVDTYLNLFNCALKDGGYVYLDNNKRYLFQGDWNYPKNWRMLLRYDTPFSWSDDCPVEIFCKMEQDQGPYNAMISLGHNQSIKDREALKRAKETIGRIEPLLKEQRIDAETNQAKAESLQAKAESLQAEIEELCLNRSKLEQTIASTQEEMKDLHHQMEEKCVEFDNLRCQAETSRIEAEELRDRLEKMLHSSSWKITRPLRLLFDTIKKWI